MSYHVVAGDLTDYIADRFGFFDPANADASGSGTDYLNTINQVRRGGYLAITARVLGSS